MRVTSVVLASALLGSTGCHMGLAGLMLGVSSAEGPYQAGAIASDLGPDAVRTLACLDVGLAITPNGADPLLEMHVGNRCIHAEPFDLQQLVMHAKGAAREERPVSLYDPRHEIVRVHVGAQARGHSRIRLRELDQVVEICFELEAVAPDAPHARPLPICLAREGFGSGWRARSAT